MMFDGVAANLVRVGMEAGIVSITPSVIMILVNYDDKVVNKELHHKNDACHTCRKKQKDCRTERKRCRGGGRLKLQKRPPGRGPPRLGRAATPVNFQSTKGSRFQDLFTNELMLRNSHEIV